MAPPGKSVSRKNYWHFCSCIFLIFLDLRRSFRKPECANWTSEGISEAAYREGKVLKGVESIKHKCSLHLCLQHDGQKWCGPVKSLKNNISLSLRVYI